MVLHVCILPDYVSYLYLVSQKYFKGFRVIKRKQFTKIFKGA